MSISSYFVVYENTDKMFMHFSQLRRHVSISDAISKTVLKI